MKFSRSILFFWCLTPLAWLILSGCQVTTVDGVPHQRGFVPSSSQAWLVELMTQRLELRANESWQRFNQDHLSFDSLGEAQQMADLVALSEKSDVRGVNIEEFFKAQNAASASLEAWLFKNWAAGKELPNVSPELLVPDAEQQLAAVNASIVATLAETGDTIYSSEYQKWARQRLIARNIRPEAAKLAVLPLSSR
ncbi:MAG: hypothetical protein ACK5LK_06870 [Chthoniobacterales bacterium]